VSGEVDLSPAPPLHCLPSKIDQKQMTQMRRETMSEQDKSNGNDPKREMTRRTTLTLAAAVATFGAAMGMRAPAAWAQDKMEGKEEGKADGKMEGKGEGKAGGKMEGKGEGKMEGKAEGKM
jgi:flagellar biosynthesis/type III secretory pathway protein FliH